MHNEISTIAGLTCRIIRPSEPEAVVVLCHGFGAPGTDLVPLADEYLRRQPEIANRVMFVFPEGPQRIPEIPGGRCWWPIDVVELQTALVEGRFREITRMPPPELPAARQRLIQMLEQLHAEIGVAWSRFVLGGFSQGAMLTTDVTLHLSDSPGGLMIYSGTLLAEQEWSGLAPRRAGLPVLQSHGTVDPLLPFEEAVRLRDLLVAAGLHVTFHRFAGMHAIPPEAVQLGARLIADVTGANR